MEEKKDKIEKDFSSLDEDVETKIEEKKDKIEKNKIKPSSGHKFKKRVKPVHREMKVNKKHKSFLDGEIDIKLKPRKILSMLVLITLFILVFQLGRISAESVSCPVVTETVTGTTVLETNNTPVIKESFIKK